MPHLNGDIVFTMLKGVVTNGKKFLWFSIKNKNNSKKKKKKKICNNFLITILYEGACIKCEYDFVCVCVCMCVCVYVCVSE